MTIAITPTTTWLPAALDHAEQQVLALADRIGGRFPHAVRDGRYDLTSASWWTSGFWPGLLWLVQQRRKPLHLALFAREAEDEIARTIGDERFYELHHDVGYQFLPSAVMRYRLTGDRGARRRGLLAAALLMSRFNPAGNFIEAWDHPANAGIAIIDTMLNLPLLYWAADEMQRPHYRNVAIAHATTAMRHFVRSDGSTHHIWRFDPVTGEPIEARGGQGFAPDTCWSRGQAWALYGFALAYRHTAMLPFLETAQRIADSFLAALPQNAFPPWDFRAADADDGPRDSSAGAIAASGLLELAELLPTEQAIGYRDAAQKIVQALSTHCRTSDGEEGVLRHASGNVPRGGDVDTNLIYGDYFYVEALTKLEGQHQTCWGPWQVPHD